MVVLKSIINLYLYNQQVNKELSYKNIGINKNGTIKIFNLGSSKFINPESKTLAKEELYSSFKIFINSLLKLLKNNKQSGQITLIESFMIDFNYTLTDKKIVETPSIDGKYKKHKFRYFKFLNFDNILQFTKEW